MANKKITDLPANSSPTIDDLVLMVDSPGGTPATKYATLLAVRDLLFSASCAPGCGEGDMIWLKLGTALAPLAYGDYPIRIDHFSTGAPPGSYGMYLVTTSDQNDGGSGFVVENRGVADGSTFAVSTLAGVGACGLAAFINHTNDIHDQYAITVGQYHGRGIIISSYGTGESIEIRRAGANSGTTKSGSHIFVNETAVNSHLIALKISGHASASASDVMISVDLGGDGGTEEFYVLQNGTLWCNGPFACNGGSPQGGYASGGALAAYSAGANGLDSGAHMAALHALVVKIRDVLVLCGIMS